MATKEQERAELHKAIWQMANQARWSVDWWDFKQYVLWMLFYRFISENLTKYINENEDFDYSTITDKDAEYGRKTIVSEKGFYILPSELFVNVVKNAKNDPNLNETMQKVFKNIESSANGTESEDDIKWLFDDFNVNSNKLWATVEQRNKKLTELLVSVANLPLGNYHDNTIDIFGDAYEYLMGMYASNAWKSGWSFWRNSFKSSVFYQLGMRCKSYFNKWSSFFTSLSSCSKI
jgi:type I restriction enzyme M protein